MPSHRPSDYVSFHCSMSLYYSSWQFERIVWEQLYNVYSNRSTKCRYRFKIFFYSSSFNSNYGICRFVLLSIEAMAATIFLFGFFFCLWFNSSLSICFDFYAHMYNKILFPVHFVPIFFRFSAKWQNFDIFYFHRLCSP